LRAGATARTCAVPPAATFINRPIAASINDQAARPVGHERQRYSGERRQPKHGEHVQDRLRDDSEVTPTAIRALYRPARPFAAAQAGVGRSAVQEQQPAHADDAELLTESPRE